MTFIRLIGTTEAGDKNRPYGPHCSEKELTYFKTIETYFVWIFSYRQASKNQINKVKHIISYNYCTHIWHNVPEIISHAWIVYFLRLYVI